MPIPEPKENEKEEDFVSRCMSDDVMKNEYLDEKQRSAICHSQMKESTCLLLHGSAPVFKEGKIFGRALHPMVTSHTEFPQQRKFIEEALQKAVGESAFPIPIIEDHGFELFDFSKNRITKMTWNPEDLAVEYEGEVEDAVADAINSGVYKNGVSVEIDFPPGSRIDFVNGSGTFAKAVPSGFRFVALSLLKRMIPSDPTTSLKVWNNAVTPSTQEMFIYWIENPAIFIQERYSVSWIDQEKGIQAIFGLKIDAPDTLSPVALLFMRINGWDQEKVEDWLKDHAQYVKSTSPPGIKSGEDENLNSYKIVFAEIRKKTAEIQQQGMTKDEIFAKITDLQKQLSQISEKLYPSPEPPTLTDDQRVELETQQAALWAEMDAYREALGELTKQEIAVQTQPPSETLEHEEDEKTKEAVKLRKELFEANDKLINAEITQKNTEQRFMQFRENIERQLPSKMIWRSWSLGPQMFVKQIRKAIGLNPEE